MVCVPAFSDDVVKVAAPCDVVPVPICLVPSKNVTVTPSAIGPRVDVMVAVKVTGELNCEGLPEVVTVVLVAAALLMRTATPAPLQVEPHVEATTRSGWPSPFT